MYTTYLCKYDPHEKTPKEILIKLTLNDPKWFGYINLRS